MVALELLLIGVILLLQPLIFITYAYVVYRLVVSFTARKSGDWVDNRVQNATEELKP